MKLWYESVSQNPTPARITANPWPICAAVLVPCRLEPVTRQTIARAIRPPSSGNAGTRLNASSSTFQNSSQLSASSTGVIWTVPSSSAAWISRCGPTIAMSSARHTITNRNVASGPAAAILKSSPGDIASRLICVNPPNRNSSIRSTPIPWRRAATACPSSWTISEPNSTSTVSTVVR